MCFGSVTEASAFFAWGNHLSCVPKQRAAEVLSFLNALLGGFYIRIFPDPCISQLVAP